MYIDTSSYETLLKDTCKYFDITEQALSDFFENLYDNFEDGLLNVDGIEKLDKFISKNSPKDPIDEILIYHFTRRLEDQNILRTDNLYELLLTKNVFSDFLIDHGIRFFKCWNDWIMKYKNNEPINFHTKSESYDKGDYGYFCLRFGYINGHTDHAINGFAFPNKGDMFEQYKGALQGCPEFIENLSFITDSCIRADYKNKSKYYLYIYKVPLKKAILESKPNLSSIDKENYFLKQILKRLYYYFNANTTQTINIENPWYYLSENANLSEENYIDRIDV